MSHFTDGHSLMLLLKTEQDRVILKQTPFCGYLVDRDFDAEIG
jgi:hypothetical protein